MNAREFEYLRTKPENIEFHTSRVMFWIIDGVIEVAPQGTQMSHSEMAEDRGWVNGDDTAEFFETHTRGFYLRGEDNDRIHFYRDLGFWFDDEVVATAVEMLPRLIEVLDLNEETRVYFGPKDKLLGGIEYPIQFAGTVQQLLSPKRE